MNENKIKPVHNVWEQLGYWRNRMIIPVEVQDEVMFLEIVENKNNILLVETESMQYELSLLSVEENGLQFRINDRFYKAAVSKGPKGVGFVTVNGITFKTKRNDILVEDEDYSHSSQGDGENDLFAPMPGKVIKINVKEGDEVHRGTILLVVEAMKMENNIVAVEDAVVEKLNVKEGDMVDTDLQLVFLKKVE